MELFSMGGAGEPVEGSVKVVDGLTALPPTIVVLRKLRRRSLRSTSPLKSIPILL